MTSYFNMTDTVTHCVVWSVVWGQEDHATSSDDLNNMFLLAKESVPSPSVSYITALHFTNNFCGDKLLRCTNIHNYQLTSVNYL